jgi:predicted aspartyl protease
MTVYNFGECGRAFLPVSIKPNDILAMRNVEFLVDTGADKTTISKAVLRKLGYDKDWIQQNTVALSEADNPKTAVGEKVNAGFIQLPLINILGYEAKNWAFQIVIDEGRDFTNLLGRDLLSGFNYTFNNDEDVFSIARTKTFKPRSEFLPGQEIYAVMGNG